MCQAAYAELKNLQCLPGLLEHVIKPLLAEKIAAEHALENSNWALHYRGLSYRETLIRCAKPSDL